MKSRGAPPTEAEIEATLARMPADVAQAIRDMRKQLTEVGVTREPLRTHMACEFAEVLIGANQARWAEHRLVSEEPAVGGES